MVDTGDVAAATSQTFHLSKWWQGTVTALYRCKLYMSMYVYCCQIAAVGNVCWVCNDLGTIVRELTLVSAS